MLGVVVAATIGLLAAPAGAHVTVDPSEAEQGGRATLTFRVPNESDTASTISLEVNVPEDVVIPSLRVKPVPGWTAEVEYRTLAAPIPDEDGDISESVSKVTWTGGAIGPGEYEEFDVSVGPLPEDVDAIAFPVIQTYDDGDVARWIEETPENGEEPDRPAPVLALTAATADDDGAGAEPAATDGASEGAATATDADDDGGSDALAIVALVVGGLGVVLGALALVRGRTRSAS
jgi:uncharacterized protein YcnI